MEGLHDAGLKGHSKSNKKNYAAYAFFFVFILSVYHLFSDGDFSFLMTLGSMSSAFAFVMLFWKMLTQNNAAGVSAKSLQMYTLVFLFRFLSIYWHEGYLPFDKSGDWIYPAMEFLSLTMCGTALFLISTKYSDSYKPALDTFGAMDPVPAQFGTVFLVVPALLIALAVHPSLNNVWWSDICWTFALYLEAVAILPQLYMFQKGDGSSGTQKRVESFVSHFVFSLGFSRLLNLWFWISSYHELSDAKSTNFVGWFVLLAQMLQMVLMADFFYFYLKAMQKGVEMTLPTSLDNV